MTSPGLVARSRGALAGAAVGDCFGSHFERKIVNLTAHERSLVNWEKWNAFLDAKLADDGHLPHTDDTIMTRTVARHLVNFETIRGGPLLSELLAEYYRDPRRQYGSNVGNVFYNAKKLARDVREKGWSDTHNMEKWKEPARRQFEGRGSHGSGASVRVAPIAIWAKSKTECIELATEQALTTHAHKSGVLGGICAALAIRQALHHTGPLDADAFMEELREDMRELENPKPTGKIDQLRRWLGYTADPKLPVHSTRGPWTYEMKIMREKCFEHRLMKAHEHVILKTPYDDVCKDSELPRGVTAVEAVPLAIYCFLRHASDGFEAVMGTSLEMASDTDTIGSIAMSMAGAYYGVDTIPQNWLDVCEGAGELSDLGEELARLRYPELDEDLKIEENNSQAEPPKIMC